MLPGGALTRRSRGCCLGPRSNAPLPRLRSRLFEPRRRGGRREKQEKLGFGAEGAGAALRGGDHGRGKLLLHRVEAITASAIALLRPMDAIAAMVCASLHVAVAISVSVRALGARRKAITAAAIASRRDEGGDPVAVIAVVRCEGGSAVVVRAEDRNRAVGGPLDSPRYPRRLCQYPGFRLPCANATTMTSSSFRMK